MSAETTTEGQPRLALRLPGSWFQLDPAAPDVTDRRIRQYVDAALGRADELAQTRADMRRGLATLIQTQHEQAPVEAMFLCHEITPGMSTPITVVVFTPDHVHMSPVIGTAPEAVIAGFREALGAMGDAEGWDELGCADGRALRRWRIDERVLAEGTEDAPLRTFVADYWRTVPGSKQLVLVTFSTPIVDVPETMARLADAVVAGSRFKG